MGNNLQFYNAAKAALAKAVKVDEVTKIHGKAAAMKAAAKVAKDKDLEADAAEIRMRAERQLGVLMAAQKESVGANKGGRPSKKKTGIPETPVSASEKTGIPETPVSEKPGTLAEAGIDKNLAKKARTESAKSEQEFERDVVDEKAKIANPAPKLRVVNGGRKSVPGLVDQCVDAVRERIKDALQQMRRGNAPKEKYAHLFAALKEVVDDAQSKALEPFDTVEESADRRRAYNAARIAEA
jgi:hypothetical protein